MIEIEKTNNTKNTKKAQDSDGLDGMGALELFNAEEVELLNFTRKALFEQDCLSCL